MNFYEVTNGYIGQSYIRVYVWASTVKDARELAMQAFKKQSDEMPKKHRYKKAYWENTQIEFLFADSSSQFVTIPSDCGYESRS